MQIIKQILACDVGLCFIGLATYVQGIVMPLEPICRINRKQAACELDNILCLRCIDILVVGIPSGGAAEHDNTKKRIQHFISLLQFKGEIYYVNEDFTSKQAFQNIMYMKPKNRLQAQKNGQIDSLSACEILKNYLECKNQ